MHPVRWAKQLSWMSVKELADAKAWALLPVGSTAAHGPHLPLSADVIIAEEVCRRTAEKLAQAGQASVIFPPVAYGLTDFSASFAGTVSVDGEVAERYLAEVIVGIASHGFGRIGVLNHHLEPAHFRAVHHAARAASARTEVRVVVTDHRKKPVGPLLGEEFMHGGSHAGFYETSLLLAAAPQWVDETARGTLPELNVNLPARIKAGAKSFHECGGHLAYLGNPRAATREDGERLFEVLACAAAQTLLGAAPQPCRPGASSI